MSDAVRGLQKNFTELKDGLAAVTNILEKDEGYYIAWKANIAMAFIDEANRVGVQNPTINQELIHQIANTAADNFLRMLIAKGQHD